jgi:hypothetical protein
VALETKHFLARDYSHPKNPFKKLNDLESKMMKILEQQPEPEYDPLLKQTLDDLKILNAGLSFLEVQ